MFPQAEVNTKTVGRLPPPPPLATLVWASSCENQLDRRAQPVKLPPSLLPAAAGTRGSREARQDGRKALPSTPPDQDINRCLASLSI